MITTPFNANGSNVFFHIGYPRTGTTFLQKFIFPQYSNKIIFQPPALTKFFLDESEFNRGKEYLIKNFSPQPGCYRKPLIISMEQLSGGNLRDYYEIPDRIFSIFPKGKIIICIRSQYTIIPSLYSHYCSKGGCKFSYEAYLKKIFENNKFDYFKMVSSYQHLFGFDSVYVMLYEDLKAEPEKYLQGVFGFIGLPEKWDLTGERQFINRRPPSFVVKGMRLANMFLESKFLLNCLPHPGHKIKLWNSIRRILFMTNWATVRLRLGSNRTLEENSRARKIILNQYKKQNMKLFNLLQIDAAGLDYPL